jgi:hypothetical protein
MRGKGFIVELSGKVFRGDFHVDDFHYENCRFGFVEGPICNVLVLCEDIEMLDLRHLDDLLWGVSGPVRLQYGSGAPVQLKETFATARDLMAYCSGKATGVRYMYHGTSDLNLPSIQANGLQPALIDGDDWKSVSDDLPAYCRGKLFLTGTKESAENFFHQKTVEGSAEGSVVILRVPSSKVVDPVPDVHEMGSCEVFTLSSIPAEFIQVEISGEWKPLQSLDFGVALEPVSF